jgi:glycosyltransferase involved in cell wall biosynthesis
MKLSIVIPVYNRKQLLLNTLESIGRSDIEVIIVDDGSDERLDFADYRVIRLERSKGWHGPCLAYNAGFKAATGDVIMINSSECVHRGNVIGYVQKHFKENDYFSFSTYMLGEDEDLGNLRFDNFWGVKIGVKSFIPYCGVISQENMAKLGGYDERFSKGIGFDDYDFTDRVKNLGLKMKIIRNPYIIHQWHKPTEYTNNINLDYLMYLRKNFPDRIRANVEP